MAALAALSLASGCNQSPEAPAPVDRNAGASDTGTNATTTPKSSETPAERATLEPVAAAPGIAVPRVTGIAPEAARRINAVLDRERQEAVGGREACRRTADGRDIEYELTAKPTYNRGGLLSFRMTGYAFCGGANGDPLYAAHSFDLHTGEAIDFTRHARTLDRPARAYYPGPAECKAAFDQPVMGATFAAAFLAEDGLGVIHSFDIGAAQSCSNHDSIVPAAEARRLIAPGGALARAWP